MCLTILNVEFRFDRLTAPFVCETFEYRWNPEISVDLGRWTSLERSRGSSELFDTFSCGYRSQTNVFRKHEFDGGKYPKKEKKNRNVSERFLRGHFLSDHRPRFRRVVVCTCVAYLRRVRQAICLSRNDDIGGRMGWGGMNETGRSTTKSKRTKSDIGTEIPSPSAAQNRPRGRCRSRRVIYYYYYHYSPSNVLSERTRARVCVEFGAKPVKFTSVPLSLLLKIICRYCYGGRRKSIGRARDKTCKLNTDGRLERVSSNNISAGNPCDCSANRT